MVSGNTVSGNIEKYRACDIGEHEHVGQLCLIEFAGPDPVEVQYTEADRADLKRQRENGTDTDSHCRGREGWPPGHAFGGRQIGNQ
jgi:hypothetical protein